MKKYWFRYLVSLIISMLIMIVATTQIKYFGIQPMMENPIEISATKPNTIKKPIELRIHSIAIDGREIPVKDLERTENWWSVNQNEDYPLYYKGEYQDNSIIIPLNIETLGKDLKIDVETLDTHTAMKVQYGHLPDQIFKYNRTNGYKRSYTIQLLKPRQLLLQYAVLFFGIIGLTVFLASKVLVPFEEHLDGTTETISQRIVSLCRFILLPMLTALIWLIIVYLFEKHKESELPFRLLHIPAGMRATFAFYVIVGGGAVGLKTLFNKYHHLSRLINVLMFVLVPYIGVFLTEISYSSLWTDLPLNFLIINWFIVLLFQGFIYVLFRSLKISLSTTIISMTLLGIANQVLITLRDSPLIPSFLKTVDVALQVSEGFGISLDNQGMWALSLAGLWLIIIMTLKEHERKMTFKRYFIPLISYGVIFSATLVGLTTFYFQETDTFGFSWWRPANSYMRRGTVWSFYYLLANSKLSEPEGYSAEAVAEILEPYYKSPASTPAEKPNIILIQSESLMDYHGINDVLFFNEDPLALTKELTKPFIQGKLYVSVIGGGTVKTEYEVLSSNQLAYFPGDHDPFWQHVEEGSYSIANYLKDLGYNTYAGHPHLSSNYYRDQSWPRLGFEQTYFFDEYYSHPSYYRFRSYLSDKSVFEHLIDIYEQNNEEPFFFFANTMQNHSNYPGDFFEPGIKVKDFKNVSKEVEEYANIVKMSDFAFEELVTYFSQVNQPTIIAIYGDHQPYHYNEFLDLAYGPDNYELTDYYYAPFYIWANFDIDHTQNLEISANYLAPYLLSQVDQQLPLSAYYRYLLDKMEEYPILTTNFNLDSKGNEISNDEDFKLFLEELDLLIYSNVMRDAATEKYFTVPK